MKYGCDFQPLQFIIGKKRKIMKTKRIKFGALSTGEKVYLYTVSNGNMSFSATNFGCAITNIMVPSKDGLVQDVVLGCSDLSGYLSGSKNPFFGAFVGRFANRIGGAKFELNGQTYNLDKNDNGNCLHSGFRGCDKIAFDSDFIKTEEGEGVKFTYFSPDGEQGFPGNMVIEVSYVLTLSNEILLTYKAATSKDTPVNFTNHTYFNLSGNFHNTILDHTLQINADSYLEVDSELIPTGKFIKMDEDKAFDFRKPKKIGQDYANTNGGYDHNFVISKSDKKLRDLNFCAEAKDEKSGRTLSVYTDLPGVQFYAGNSMGGSIGKWGQIHEACQGFCLETQQFPDAPNQKDFPSCILHAGESLETRTIFAFSW